MSAAFATVLVGAGLVVTATTAQAAGRDGVCEAGEFCLYYNSNQAGSVSDFRASISDYGSSQPSCYDFKGSGNGKGVCVKNNAASVWNRTSSPVTVYYNSGYKGATQVIKAGVKANLNTTLKNDNAGHKLNTSASVATEKLTTGLYDAAGRVTAGFDGYVNTPGRHEGIDMQRGIGAPVHALIRGEVINIVRGSTGSGGLSTIAIYNSQFDKTIIYLHTQPLDSLRVGHTITRGQRIASESWRGVSSSSAHHTHVEMRLGRRTLAAKSVNDYTLENPNPTQFWRDRGYRIA